MRDSAKISGIGQVREENQDSFFLDDDAGLYAVADGMGGCAEGGTASAMMVEQTAVAAKAGLKRNLASRVEIFMDAIADANEAILAYARRQRYRQMGTTLAALWFDPDDASRAVVCHVGDSRVYRLRGDELVLLTRDHTVIAELTGALGGETMPGGERHPLAHMLTRAVGTEAAARPEWRRIEVEDGDVYLICSDGVHGMLADAEIAAALRGAGPAAACRRLAKQVEARGAGDNYTAVVIHTKGGR